MYRNAVLQSEADVDRYGRGQKDTLSHCYMARLLLCPLARTLSQYVPTDADFIRNQGAVFRDMINGTPVPVSPKCIMSHNNNNNNNNNNIFHGVGPLVDPFRSHVSSLQRSTMIPSAIWGVVFHYPG